MPIAKTETGTTNSFTTQQSQKIGKMGNKNVEKKCNRKPIFIVFAILGLLGLGFVAAGATLQLLGSLRQTYAVSMIVTGVMLTALGCIGGIGLYQTYSQKPKAQNIAADAKGSNTQVKLSSEDKKRESENIQKEIPSVEEKPNVSEPNLAHIAKQLSDHQKYLCSLSPRYLDFLRGQKSLIKDLETYLGKSSAEKLKDLKINRDLLKVLIFKFTSKVDSLLSKNDMLPLIRCRKLIELADLKDRILASLEKCSQEQSKLAESITRPSSLFRLFF